MREDDGRFEGRLREEYEVNEIKYCLGCFVELTEDEAYFCHECSDSKE